MIKNENLKMKEKNLLGHINWDILCTELGQCRDSHFS